MRTRLFVTIYSISVVALVVATQGISEFCLEAQSGCVQRDSNVGGWPKNAQIKYDLSGLPDSETDPNSPRKQARRAFEKWNTANTQNSSNVKFTEVSGGASNMRVSAGSAPNGKPAGTTVAVTGVDNAATGADTKIDINNRSFYDPAQPGYGNAIEKATLHEIGHTMGIKSPTEDTCANQTSGGSVMNCSSGVNDQNNLTATNVGSCEQDTLRPYYQAGGPFMGFGGGGEDPCEFGCTPGYEPIPPGESCHSEATLDQCGCCATFSPIIINLTGNQTRMSDVVGGVVFDINGLNHMFRIGWPLIPSEDAWLARDVDGNGSIDSGAELFGNATRLRSRRPAGNGYHALADLDVNVDGIIDAADPVFAELLLWTDLNRDGLSAPDELLPFGSRFTGIETDARESRRRDGYGNVFRYRARVHAVDGSFWYSYDVYPKARFLSRP